MDLSFRRIAGRMVLAAGVCAAAILVVRGSGDGPSRVTFVVDPRPLGADLQRLEVTITAGDEPLGAWQSGEHDRDHPLQPLRLVTPAPGGEVTITLDALTAGGPRRKILRTRAAPGSTVEITLGASE